MKKRALAYAWLISIAGVALGAYCLHAYGHHLLGMPDAEELAELLVLTALFVICRSLPLYIDENSAVDMSFICLLAAMLLRGPQATVSMIVLSTPFAFEPDAAKTGRRVFTIFNMSPLKTLFNMANPIIAVSVGGLLFSLAGGVTGNITLPGVLGPGVLFIFAVIFLNSSILYALLALNGQARFVTSILHDFVQLLPSWIAAAPLGYFIALLTQMTGGAYLALLFMLPLLLARFAFKMYLESRKQYFNLIRTLTAAVEAKDKYTNGHSIRVGEYSELIARAMKLPKRQIDEIKNASMLHDIGKIGIQDAILNKPGRLTDEERNVIQAHPHIAIDIIGNSNITPKTQEMILHHHEFYDGRGYPGGTKGDELALSTYVIAAADAFDAITSDRPYRKGRSLDVAMQILEEESGRQFHPDVVRAFVSIREQVAARMKAS